MAELFTEMDTYFAGNEHCIAISGSGGKTTALISLAKYYAKQQKRVLISTTTKLLLPKDEAYGCDTHFFDASILDYRPSQGERVFYSHVDKKAVAPPLQTLKNLLPLYDVVLLEADGSRHLGLKLHDERDPVIPEFVTATLAIVSFSLLGKPFKKNCFGSELYLDDFSEQIIDLHTYEKLLNHPQGITKGLRGKTLILFNQAEKQDIADCKALQTHTTHPLWFASLRNDQLIYRKPV